MNLNQIAKELEKQTKLWEKILNYKTKPKDKQLAEAIRKDEPDPKAKSISNDIHPGRRILELLEKAYHHQEFPREMDARCNELYQEVSESIPNWPSLEFGNFHKQSVIEHICNFTKLLYDADGETTRSSQAADEKHYEPFAGTTKQNMMTALNMDSYHKFKSFAERHGIRPVGKNRQLHQICVDDLPRDMQEKIAKLR